MVEYLLGGRKRLESGPIRNHQGRALERDEIAIPEIAQCTSDSLPSAADKFRYLLVGQR